MASVPKAKVNDLNNRAEDFGIFDKLTLQDVRAVNQYYDFTCSKCGAKPAISIDHVKPLSLGGENKRRNLQNLCIDCNKVKGDTEQDFRPPEKPFCPDDFVSTRDADNKQQAERTYRKHNWSELQFEYVTTELSLRELADKYEMDASLVLKRAASERWLKEREKFAINLLSDVQREATRKEVSSRVMILEAARIALEEWKGNDKPTELDDLAKILQLAAQVEGLELNRQTLTVKDWRDVATERGADAGELEAFFERIAGTDVRAVDRTEEEGFGAGWSD